jgi:hypothetical protein
MREFRFSIILSGALEQRIALELSFHVGGKVQVGELQQLDGLHQLRRHHKGMALPDFESLSKRHGLLRCRFPAQHDQLRTCLVGPILAYRLSDPVYTRTTALSLKAWQGPHNSGDNG